MKIDKVLNVLEEFAPYALAEAWDNVGLLVGDRKTEVTRVLCALDATEDVIAEAVEKGANLIVSHHPVIFGSISRINTDNNLGQDLIHAIKHDISIISMHTNLDATQGGVNDALAEKLGLGDIETMGAGDSGQLGRVGNLFTPMNLDVFASFVKERLECGAVRFVSPQKQVYRVAVGGGACGKLMEHALEKGADTFVTSDCSYDLMQKALRLKLNLIDAGHFATENVVVARLARVLKENLEIEVLISDHRDCISFV